MTELDPSFGASLNRPGAKADDGKLRTGLVINDFARALTEVAAIGTFGAAKYTPHGWIYVPNGIDRYTDALYRHLLAEQIEALDKDSGLLHAAHAAWNALARLDLMLRAIESGRVVGTPGGQAAGAGGGAQAHTSHPPSVATHLNTPTHHEATAQGRIPRRPLPTTPAERAAYARATERDFDCD